MWRWRMRSGPSRGCTPQRDTLRSATHHATRACHRRDRRWDYGEDRYRLLASIEGRVFVLIYTMRGSAIRIISARKANGKEVREYEHKARQD